MSINVDKTYTIFKPDTIVSQNGKIYKKFSISDSKFNKEIQK